MRIIKRSGKEEPFNGEKIRASLAAASDEVKCPLNAGDLSGIVGELEQMLEGKESVTSRQVYVMLAGILYTRGFKGALERYVGYEGNPWA